MAKPRYLPYGYRIQNGLIAPDTAQADCVRQIYRLYLAGNSLQEIAKRLQATGIPYSDETGWNKNTIHRIVKNPAYCGTGRYPPIVEETLFQKAQALCQRKAPTYNEALKDVRGDIICPNCGRKLEWQTKGHQWRCRHCAGFSVRIEPDILLQSIAAAMKRLQDNPDSINDLPLSHNTVSIEAEKRQAEIDEMLSAGEFDTASFMQAVLTRADALRDLGYTDSTIGLRQRYWNEYCVYHGSLDIDESSMDKFLLVNYGIQRENINISKRQYEVRAALRSTICWNIAVMEKSRTIIRPGSNRKFYRKTFA